MPDERVPWEWDGLPPQETREIEGETYFLFAARVGIRQGLKGWEEHWQLRGVRTIVERDGHPKLPKLRMWVHQKDFEEAFYVPIHERITRLYKQIEA